MDRDITIPTVLLIGILGHAFILECLNEVLAQVDDVWVLLFELVDGDGVRYGLNQATSWTRSNNIEGHEPQFELVRLENCVELFDQLGCKLLLSQVVGAFHNDGD